MFKSFSNCPLRYFSENKNKIQPGNPDYPSYSWGHQLPDDKSFDKCKRTDMPCHEGEQIQTTYCPRITKTDKLCPVCIESKLENPYL